MNWYVRCDISKRAALTDTPRVGNHLDSILSLFYLLEQNGAIGRDESRYGARSRHGSVSDDENNLYMSPAMDPSCSAKLSVHVYTCTCT